MPSALVKLSVSSPLTYPAPIEIVALDRLLPLSTSLTVTESSCTGAPPKPKFAVPPAVMVGATCTVFKVLVAAAELDVPSLTTQSMVRLVCEPPPVGSPPAVKL